MARIEDYAVVGDLHTGALVNTEGSIDWLCLPRFDSPACFNALLDTPEAGRWLLAPENGGPCPRGRHPGGGLVLERAWGTPGGAGRAIAGPDAVYFVTPAPLHGENMHTVSDFTVSAGERVPFVLTWAPSHVGRPHTVDAEKVLDTTYAFWRGWASQCTVKGKYQDAVVRSLVTLKALTYAPTGGIVAAVTTSLPEQLGGVRNWDYRFCWLRDATITLQALLYSGFEDEAAAWRKWLLRAIAGDPVQMQIMYGVGGERRLEEYVADWLPGYEGNPVRIGNAASEQFQLDVYGEVMDALHQARLAGLKRDDPSWALQAHLMSFVEKHWSDPDEGIWEVRGGPKQFTHSKLMAWVAADRAVKAIERFGLPGPAARWRGGREDIRRDILTRGYDADRGTFTQYYRSRELDAALLMVPLVGFLPADDSRVRGTVSAIERELLQDDFVQRYTQAPSDSVDGLPAGEGAFLACTFWLADNYALQGRHDQAREVFERLLALRNDVGLLSEEYDPEAGRLVGNFPQAFSHVPLIDTARTLSRATTSGTEERQQSGLGCPRP